MPRDTILFDINETVLDLSSLKPKFERVFADPAILPLWFSTLLHSSTIAVLTGVKTGFAELAGHALENMAARYGIDLREEQKSDILGSFAALKPHQDVIPALKILRAKGYRTVAFSNSSNDLITRQINNAGLSEYFDRVISVEETQSFKPDGKVYQYGAKLLERDISDLRLIATHDWDTHGALVAGMKAAYIDRSQAPYHPLFQRPDVFGSDMEDVVKQIIARDIEAN